MSIIIRLQNLPWSANALDIRQFFSGLQIPEGGVHIVGGELGDAFIAFSSDEDARQAFLRNNSTLKGVQVKLMLSSRSEMHRVIEEARNQCLNAFMLSSNAPAQTPSQPSLLPSAVPQISQVMPAPVPEIPKDSKDRDENNGDKRRDSRRRSRSRSRDRRDRSRDRSRRYRDRSRSRSRERRDRDRRRRERSRSRNRSHEKSSRRDSTKSTDRRDDQKKPDPWANTGPGILAPSPWALNTETVKNALVANLQANLQVARGLGGLQAVDNSVFRNNIISTVQSEARESWPAANPPSVRETLVKSPVDYPTPPLVTSKFKENAQGPKDSQIINNPKQHIRDSNSPKNDSSKKFGYVRENGKRSRFEVDQSVNSCVSVSPFYGPYADLRQFFHGLSINYQGIKIINDNKGDRTGTSYIRFRDNVCKKKALLMNGRFLNQVKVQIKSIDDAEFEKAIDAYRPNINQNNDNTHTEEQDFDCLKVEDLPTYVKEQDILHIFSSYPLTSLHLHCKPKGGSVAYVKFNDKNIAKVALQQRCLHFIGNKPVTVKPCDIEEFNEANDIKLEKPKPIQTVCLSLRNLPSKTTDRDITDLFSDIGVIPFKTHLLSNDSGFLGQAYCEFENEEDTAKALRKDKTILGQNVIAIEPISAEELEGILNKAIVRPPRFSPPPVLTTQTEKDVKEEIEDENNTNIQDESENNVQNNENSDMNFESDSKEEGLANSRSKIAEAIKKFKEEALRQYEKPIKAEPQDNDDRLNYDDSQIFSNRFEPPRKTFNDSRDGYDDKDYFDRPRRDFDGFRRDFDGFRRDYDGPRRDYGGPRRDYDIPRNDFDEARLYFDEPRVPRGFGPRGGGFPPRGGNFGPRGGSFRPRGEMFGPRGGGMGPRGRGGMFPPRGGLRFNPHRDEVPEDDELPGCTVYMDNVPYKAGTNEILEFFEGYNSTEHVSRRYNANNTPTAEAKVTFYNPDDAFRAVQELNEQKIWNRTIYLRQQ